MDGNVDVAVRLRILARRGAEQVGLEDLGPRIQARRQTFDELLVIRRGRTGIIGPGGRCSNALAENPPRRLSPAACGRPPPGA